MGCALGPDLAGRGLSLWPVALAAAAAGTLVMLCRRRAELLWLGPALVLIGGAASADVFTTPTEPDHVYLLRGRTAVVEGVVLDGPRMSYDRRRMSVETRLAAPLGSPLQPARGRVHVTVDGPGRLPAAGSLVRFTAQINSLSGFANPGVFDYRRYMAAQGFRVGAYLSSPRLMVEMSGPGGTWFRRALGRVRGAASLFIDARLHQPVRGLAQAMLLGSGGELEDDLRDNFRRLGLSHLLAISGLHVGLVAGAGYWLFLNLLLIRPEFALRVNVRRIAGVAALGPVFLYWAVAGGRPSTTRAAVMVAVFLLALLAGRRRDHLSALAAAAWAILVIQPGSIFAASFQLSFAAAGAIVIAAPKFFARLRSVSPEESARPRLTAALLPLAQAAFFPAAALLGTAPVAAWHFGQLPLLSLPANLIVTPLVSLIVVPPGLAALATAPVLPQAAGLVFMVMERLLWPILAVVEQVSAMPWVETTIARPGLFFMAGYYGLVASLVFLRPLRRTVIAAGFCLVVVLAPTIWSGLGGHNRLEVAFLDVGHGSAVHVRLPGGAEMMLDAGGLQSTAFDTGRDLVAPYLRWRGVSELDIIAASHPHPDHYSGLFYLLHEFAPGELWTNSVSSGSPRYRQLLAEAKAAGLSMPDPDTLGQGRSFGRAVVRALAPGPELLKSYRPGNRQDENNSSLVLKIDLGRRSVLLPGDIEAEGEARLLGEWGDAIRSDILLAPHHGSRTSMTIELLRKVRPLAVVFSAAAPDRTSLPAPMCWRESRLLGPRSSGPGATGPC